MKTFILILSLVGGSAWAADKCADDAHYPLISKKDLAALVQNHSATIFDVNGQESYDKAHVPGAIHYGSHKSDFATLLPQDKSATIVAYCGGPQCEAWKSAAVEACKKGYTNIRHFKGGISGWVAKN